MFRTGRIMVASWGMTGWFLSVAVPGASVTFASDIDPPFHGRLFEEFQGETSIGKLGFSKPETPGRKRYLALELSVGDFETMHAAAARDRTRTTETHYRDPVGIDCHLHGVTVDAGKDDGYQNFRIGLGDIDRRFPAQFANRRGDRLEELAMQSLGAIDHLASRRPHQGSRIDRGHD